MLAKIRFPLLAGIVIGVLATAPVIVLLRHTGTENRDTGDNRFHSLLKSSRETRSTSRVRSPVQPLVPATSSDEDFEKLGAEAAKSGMEGVLLLLADLNATKDREDLIRGAFHQAASLEPHMAIDWAKRLKPGHQRNTALMTLLCEWSGKTTLEWLAQPEFRERGIAVSLGSLLLESGKASTQEIVAYSREFTSGKSFGELIGQTAARLAPDSPDTAFEMGAGMNAEAFASFSESFIRHWAAMDMKGVTDWVISNERNLDLSKPLERLMSHLLDHDVREAANCLPLFSQNSPDRRNQITRIGTAWSIEDIEGAFDWAESLPLPDEKATALDAIQATAPVGIGAAIHGDAIMSILPNSPANQVGLTAGDRIVALTNPDGTWVETAGMASADIVRHIRGRPNSRIDLRIQAQTGEIRGLTVTRRPIEFPKQP